MGLRDIESKLPPGFRFFPTDEELVCHYLVKKVAANADDLASTAVTLLDVDLHTREPWELPEAARLSPSEWYFFSFRDRKYSTGSRANRATRTGYWKATGKDRAVRDPRASSLGAMAGMRKTLVFYLGRAPNGIKTSWIMHEFRLESPLSPPKQEDWVLCRVFERRKSEGVSNCQELDQEQEPNNANAAGFDFIDDPPAASAIDSGEPPFGSADDGLLNFAWSNYGANFLDHEVSGDDHHHHMSWKHAGAGEGCGAAFIFESGEGLPAVGIHDHGHEGAWKMEEEEEEENQLVFF